jgi:diguanylate cyclase (GGDEF)-like protein
VLARPGPLLDQGDAPAVVTLELAHRALHDESTSPPNRTLFSDRLSHRLSLADRRQTGFAVLFLDLDNVKTINDTFGHSAGDRLPVAVVSRVRAALRCGQVTPTPRFTTRSDAAGA